jgi:phosphatidate phosphatase APP1
MTASKSEQGATQAGEASPSETDAPPTHLFERLQARLGDRRGARSDYHVAAYAGYGTPNRVRLRGRVLRGQPVPRGAANDRLWRNLVGIYARLESDEVRGARIQLELGGSTVETITDAEGYYDVWIHPERIGAEEWLRGSARLLSAGRAEGQTGGAGALERPLAHSDVAALIPRSPSLGVISDIDDTVLVSDAAHLLRSAQRLLTGNAQTRLPFPGVADFYHALQRGYTAPGFASSTHAATLNPIFYVSSSPWNLYDLLTDFFALNNVPAGPLFLRDFGLRANPGAAGHHGHKLAAIDEILGLYPALPFVLIGDSGQQDPEIYTEAVRRHGDRIRAIYIRDVGDEARDSQVVSLAAETARLGTPMLLTPDSFSARSHAEQLGLVAPS